MLKQILYQHHHAAGLQIKGDGTTAGALQLNCEQNSHGIKLQSSSTLC